MPYRGLRKFTAEIRLLRLTLITRKTLSRFPRPGAPVVSSLAKQRYHRGIRRCVHCEIAATNSSATESWFVKSADNSLLAGISRKIVKSLPPSPSFLESLTFRSVPAFYVYLFLRRPVKRRNKGSFTEINTVNYQFNTGDNVRKIDFT